MNHIVAQNSLKIISRLLNDWNVSGSIDAIDRDLLLAKIRELYQTVRYTETEFSARDTASGRERRMESKEGSKPEAAAPTFGRNVVRALYEERAGEALSNPEQPQKSKGVADNRESAAPPASPTRQSPGGRVLGDVIVSTRATIADRLNPAGADLAAKLGHDKITSLRGAIGLNDKYMFVRDLFGGDASLYEEAISKLDSFTSIEDAMIYIYDNHRWNPESEAAARLSSMLTAKLM